MVALLWKFCAAHFQMNEMASSVFGLPFKFDDRILQLPFGLP